jgi:hypothetical protein
MAAEALGNDNPRMQKVLLVGRLTGSAAAWLQALGSRLDMMNYQDVKAELLKHFAGEELGSLRKLQSCKQGNRDVSSYNEAFLELAAATGNVAHEIQVKDLYIKGLNNPRIKELLGLVLDRPLQQLMTKALDLGYTMNSQSSLKTTRPSTTHQGVAPHSKDFV